MKTPPESAADSALTTRSRELVPSAILILGFLVTLKIVFALDATIVEAARPNLHDGFGLIPSTEQWVAIGCLFTVAVLTPGTTRHLRRSTVQPSTLLHPFHLGTGARA